MVCRLGAPRLVQHHVSGCLQNGRLRAGRLHRRMKANFTDMREIGRALLPRLVWERTRLARPNTKIRRPISIRPEGVSTDGGVGGVRARKFCRFPEVYPRFELDLAPPLRNPDGRRLVFQTSHSLLSATTRRPTPQKTGSNLDLERMGVKQSQSNSLSRIYHKID